MVVIADNRIPDQAKKVLEKYGNVCYLLSSGITYDAISGHPDIFCCQIGTQLVVAPNAPGNLIDNLTHSSVSRTPGETKLGNNYPLSASYNAVVTDNFFIHHFDYTDPEIKVIASGRERIHVNQAYTRCNLIPLKNDRFITSDKGIENILLKKELDVLYVKPDGIILSGFENGFIGGACGIHEKKIFFIGNLNHYPEGKKIRGFLSGYEIIELYDGSLFDGGSLIFI